MPLSYAARRAVIGRVQYGDAIAHALRRHGEHTAELTPAEESQHCSGSDAHKGGSVISATIAF